MARRTMTSRGFSVTELVIAMAMFGILTAVSAPQIRLATQRAKVKAAANEFTSLISLARTTAVRDGRQAELHLDAATGRFWIEVDAASSTKDTISYVRTIATDGVTATSTRSLVCFDRRGLAVTPGSCQSGDVTVTFSYGNHADTVQTTVMGKVLR